MPNLKSKKIWHVLPLYLIAIWWLFLLFLIAGGADYLPCTMDGVGFSYVAFAFVILWIGGTVPLLLISAALLFYLKYQPEWEYHLWSLLLIPVGLLMLPLFRVFYCEGWQEIFGQIFLMITGGASFFFFFSIITAIVSFVGMRWSKRRLKNNR